MSTENIIPATAVNPDEDAKDVVEETPKQPEDALPEQTGEPLPDFQVISLIINYDDGLPSVELITGNVDGSDAGAQLHFRVPEYAKYFTTFNFIVRNRTLKNIKYKQVVKKAGIPFRTRMVEIGPEFAPNDPKNGPAIYSVDLPGEETPGGFLVRGLYSAHSTYYAGPEEEIILESPWTLEIVKKVKT
ncbi:hypothetical protein BABINDRAFT_40153 [Babjeviella inositovora NRRL Y-12698]|uniref:Rho GDP-dissociation inhibitor n=1 Tax=Babjeviella inositovora NRRL Y-12698 TaxID=984486 RepID=A0A1E3QK89_9ASCO|nr:uncharacterized protein BABINDRAFT_40153 [Babjeviella inositovora NRRL Y-12698]ODQ78103.1 hypothetical protein BABINDRAFT_40153 [Babjeviella inositovora NRRL Y-12698]